jgi:sulfur transfer complex TusBCD TusB component (DsrH family)
MSEINKEVLEDDEAYLIVPAEHAKIVANPETVWAKIDDDGKLETLRWDIVEMYALEYDSLGRNGKTKSQTHVICKLLVLVRDQVRKEYAGR